MKKRLLAMLVCLCLLAPLSALALTAGDTGEEVMRLQEKLISLGLMTGKADGVYGKQTTAAVSEAQRLLNAAGIAVPSDGAADAQTLAAIYDDASYGALTTLRRASKGERVRELQARLIDLKLYDGLTDGAYGAATEAAVLGFQRKMLALGATGIKADGVADNATCALLMEDLSQYGFQAPIYFDMSQPLALTADDLYAKGCILIDALTGETLFGVDQDARLYPASTTKIMTLLLAIEHGGLEELVTIPECAKDVPADSTVVPVTPGEEMRMMDLLYGLMLNSGNDAANAVAELCAGSVESFVELMNRRAAELAMTNTHFANPHGYHDDSHYTTAYDLALLTRQGLTDPVFCQIVTCLAYELPATNLRDALALRNTCEIFDPASPYYIPNAAGVKKGYTSLAGFCYVGAAQKEATTLIAVTLDSPNRTRTWLDLQKLFAYGFAKAQ